jgi:diguanylate cyclase (GGDEF)-like protein
MVASSSLDAPDPGLVAPLGVLAAVTLAAQWAVAAGLRRSLYSGSEQGARLRRLEELNRALSADRVALQAESRTDPLTGLANRRYLEEVLHSEWNRCRRSGAALSCLLIDIDYFKPYNDHYGHDGGDACLEQVASVLQNSSRRASDLVSRIGGEEFVVLLPETGADGATTVADMLKRAVSAAAIPHAQSPLGGHVTVSAGVATLVPDHDGTPAELLKAADLALYDAKRGGRNRIVMASLATFDLARMSVHGLTASNGHDANIEVYSRE